MEPVVKIDRAALRELLLSHFEQTLAAVADAVDGARPGRWINDSEEPAREALDRLRKVVYEAAMQARINAAEAAFSPSAQREARPAAAPQGTPEA